PYSTLFRSRVENVLVDYFAHQRGLAGDAVWPEHVHEVGAGHQQLAGSRRAAGNPHRGILAQTDIRPQLHITDLRAEAQAGELDVFEVTELDDRASGVEVIDAVQRGVAAVAGQVEGPERQAVVV